MNEARRHSLVCLFRSPHGFIVTGWCIRTDWCSKIHTWNNTRNRLSEIVSRKIVYSNENRLKIINTAAAHLVFLYLHSNIKQNNNNKKFISNKSVDLKMRMVVMMVYLHALSSCVSHFRQTIQNLLCRSSSTYVHTTIWDATGCCWEFSSFKVYSVYVRIVHSKPSQFILQDRVRAYILISCVVNKCR